MERYQRFGILSGYWVLLTRGGKTLGSLSFSSQSPDAYGPEDRELMDHIARQVTIAVENALAFEKIRELRRKIEDEKVYLEEEIRAEYRFDEIVGNSAAIRDVLKQIETAAPTDSTVLIQGETGTGKELVARAIHQLSRRSKERSSSSTARQFRPRCLKASCWATKKARSPGALAQRIGRFELANRGTLFMDEIGELPLELQPKLLRVLAGRPLRAAGRIAHHRSPISGWWPPPIRILRAMVDRTTFSRGSVLSHQCFPHHDSSAARAPRRYSDPGPLLRPGILHAHGQTDRIDSRGGDDRAGELHLARQHPRAAQRAGTERNRDAGQTPAHPQGRAGRIRANARWSA